MSEVLGVIWTIIGIGFCKDLTKMAICFGVAGIFMGVSELKYLRRELEDWEE